MTQLALDLFAAPAAPPPPRVPYRFAGPGPYRIFHGDDPVPCVAGLITNLACAEAVVRALNGDQS